MTAKFMALLHSNVHIHVYGFVCFSTYNMRQVASTKATLIHTCVSVCVSRRCSTPNWNCHLWPAGICDNDGDADGTVAAAAVVRWHGESDGGKINQRRNQMGIAFRTQILTHTYMQLNSGAYECI